MILMTVTFIYHFMICRRMMIAKFHHFGVDFHRKFHKDKIMTPILTDSSITMWTVPNTAVAMVALRLQDAANSSILRLVEGPAELWEGRGTGGTCSPPPSPLRTPRGSEFDFGSLVQ